MQRVSGSPEDLFPSSSPPLGINQHLRYHRDRFNKRARARTTTHAPTADQRRWLDERCALACARGEAPWAAAMLHPRGQMVLHGPSQPIGCPLEPLGARHLRFRPTPDTVDCLRVSAPFAFGGQSLLQRALNPAGEPFALRSEFFETFSWSAHPRKEAGGPPLHLQAARVEAKFDEHHALVACRSPMRPLHYVGVERVDQQGSDGSLHSLLPFCRADAAALRTAWQPRKSDLLIVTAQLAIDVGTRLSLLHAAGYGHFDIKPKNVMLYRDQQFEPIDFGCAQALRGQPISGTCNGSRQYMSPEALLGGIKDRVIGAPSDLFSLGLTLLDMLTNFARIEHSIRPHRDLQLGLDAWHAQRKASAWGQQVATPTEKSSMMRPMPWDALRASVQALEPRFCWVLDGLLAKAPEQRWTASRLVARVKVLQATLVAEFDLAIGAKDATQQSWRASLYARAWAPFASVFAPTASALRVNAQTCAALEDALGAFAQSDVAARQEAAQDVIECMPPYPATTMVKSASSRGDALPRVA